MTLSFPLSPASLRLAKRRYSAIFPPLMNDMNPDVPAPPPMRSPSRLRSGHWKAIAALMAMVAALAVVWAVLTTFTVRQREADLEMASTELNDLRELINRMEARGVVPALSPEELLDEFLPETAEDWDPPETIDLDLINSLLDETADVVIPEE